MSASDPAQGSGPKLSKPRPAEAPPMELAETAAPLELELGLHRCPYCREGVEANESLVCQACLTRHHPLCWVEARRCSSCGGQTPLGDGSWTAALLLGAVGIGVGVFSEEALAGVADGLQVFYYLAWALILGLAAWHLPPVQAWWRRRRGRAESGLPEPDPR